MTGSAGGSVPAPEVAGPASANPNPLLAPEHAATVASPTFPGHGDSSLSAGLVAVAAVLLVGTAAGNIRLIFTRAAKSS
jgi:hypothetical protein